MRLRVTLAIATLLALMFSTQLALAVDVSLGKREVTKTADGETSAMPLTSPVQSSKSWPEGAASAVIPTTWLSV